MTPTSDFVTIVTSFARKWMVKRHGFRDGQEVTHSYDNSYHVVSRQVPVRDLFELTAALENVDQRSCVIWGQHVAGLNPAQPHRRITRDKTQHGDITEPARYEAAAHRYLLLDLDGTESVPGWQVPLGQDQLDARVQNMLPPELRGIGCWYALSASAGLGQGDRVKLRLGFWLDRSITGDEAKEWLGQTGPDGKRRWPAIDLSIYAPAQPIYIAPPRFEDGRVDPLGEDGIPGWKGLKRSGLLYWFHWSPGVTAGDSREVCVPEILSPPREQQRSAPEGLEESADDPALITVLHHQIDWFKNTYDIGTSPGGGRVFKLACWLLKIRVGNKTITQDACRTILEERYRDVTDEVVANAAAAVGGGRGSVDMTLHPDPAGRFGPTMDELIEGLNRKKENTSRAPIAGRKILIKTGSEVKMKNIDWLWKDWLAYGKLHLIAGSKGDAKSTISIDLAAKMSVGAHWPTGAIPAEIGDTLLFSSEDGLEDTILPRFVAAGGNPDRLHFIDGTTDEQGHRLMFDPSRDIPLLDKELNRFPDTRMLILDPFALLIRSETGNNAGNRRDMQAVVDLAERRGLVLIGITHFSKNSENSSVVDRFTGSLALGAQARILLATASNADSGARRIVKAASNIGAANEGIDYSVQAVTLAEGINTTQIRWGRPVSGDAAELLAEIAGTETRKSAEETAMAFIRRSLDENGGRVPSAELLKAAEAHSISGAAYRRARARMDGEIRVEKDGHSWVTVRAR